MAAVINEPGYRPRNRLEQDEDLLHLSHSLALAERMHFFMLVCEPPSAADKSLEIIEEIVVGQRQEAVLVQRLKPSLPVGFTGLLSSLLEPLLNPGKNGAQSVLFIMDASLASKEESRDWILLFARMNEVRNTLMDRLPGPLLLVLPPFLEIEFAYNAPDFRSVCSTLARVKYSPYSLSIPAPPAQEYLVQLKQWQSRSRQTGERLAQSTKKTSTVKNYIDSLYAQGDKEMAQGHSLAARSVYEECLEVIRFLVSMDPSYREWRRKLSVSLEKIGDVNIALDNIDKSLSAYKECLACRYELSESKPGVNNQQYDLAMSYLNLAVVWELKNNSIDALDYYRKAEKTLKKIIPTPPPIIILNKALKTCKKGRRRLQDKGKQSQVSMDINQHMETLLSLR